MTLTAMSKRDRSRIPFITMIAGLAATAATAGLAFTPPSVAAPVQVATRIPSDNCSVGMIIDYDGSAGASTPSQAIQRWIDWAETNPDKSVPTRTKVLIRTLKATQASIAGAATTSTGTIIVTGTERNSGQFAEVTIERPSAGGYVAGMIRGAAFVDDGPECLATNQTENPAP